MSRYQPVNVKETTHRNLVIEGSPTVFEGEVRLHGFKHSFVMAVAAAALADGEIVIGNYPDIVETREFEELFETQGGIMERTDLGMRVDATELMFTLPIGANGSSIHGYGYLIPAALKRSGFIRVVAAGGCQIGGDEEGTRPVRHYVTVLNSFGIEASSDDSGEVVARSTGWLGTDLDLADFMSSGVDAFENHYSGATKMALLLAAAASTPSVLANPYVKADVLTLISTLRLTGVNIEMRRREDSSELVITPPRRLMFGPNSSLRLPPDLIELMTFVVAGTIIATGPLLLCGAGQREYIGALRSEFQALETMGIVPEVTETDIRIRPQSRIAPADIHVRHFDSIFSDSQPFFAFLASWADGRSSIRDDVWPKRFKYADQLRKLGLPMHHDGDVLQVDGPVRRAQQFDEVTATDLRAAAVLTLAALTCPGPVKVNNAGHLDRGYPDLVGSLASLGANLKWSD